jgi:hypothetical protein
MTYPRHWKASDIADYEERAAIIEHDGKLPKADAERIARACVQNEVIRRAQEARRRG